VEPAAVSARNRELLNLAFAAIVASAAFASVSIVGTGLVTTRWLGYVGVVFGLYLIAHVVARYTVPYADPTLLPLVGLLTALGLTVIYRLDPEDARRQAVWVALGIGILAATLFWLRFDYRVLERYKYIFGISAVVLLLLPSVPGLGHRVNGVKLWIKVGPMQFQPGELAKIFMIIFLAGYLRDKREALAKGRLKDLGPLLLIWGAAMLVLVQTSDLGSALLNFGIFLAMVYAATGRFIYVAAGLGLFLAGSAALYNALDRVQQRVTVWLHPWTDERVYCSINGKLDFRQNCDSYQLVKSLYSIANGGYGGTGLGKGTFTTVDGTQLIPYLKTDFIYSAIAQEVGLIGSAAVLLLVMVFVARGMRIALLAQDGFSKLLATGLTFGLALQTFIIVGGVLRVVPLTGITLPFVSYGGSSILSNFVMLALLLLVSNRAAATAAHR
jgi:cell division protein FtsW (lipid II flippase)